MLNYDDAQESSKFISKGIIDFENRKWIDAITCFDKAIEHNPEAITAYQYRGTCKCHLAKSDNLSIPKRSYYLKGALSDFEQVSKFNEKLYNSTLNALKNA